MIACHPSNGLTRHIFHDPDSHLCKDMAHCDRSQHRVLDPVIGDSDLLNCRDAVSSNLPATNEAREMQPSDKASGDTSRAGPIEGQQDGLSNLPS
jgi:hypothetical protein